MLQEPQVIRLRDLPKTSRAQHRLQTLQPNLHPQTDNRTPKLPPHPNQEHPNKSIQIPIQLLSIQHIHSIIIVECIG